MVRVQVQLHGFAAATAGGDSFSASVSSALPEAMSELPEQIPGLDKALGASSFTILLNGANVLSLIDGEGRAPALHDGDVLTLIPFVGGG